MHTTHAIRAAPGSGRAKHAPVGRDRTGSAPVPLRCGRGRRGAERSFVSGTPRHPAANDAPSDREPRPVGRQPVGGAGHRRGAEPDRIPRWRRRRDSNPRYAFGAYNGLANRRLQPLGHVSARAPAHIRGPRGAGNARAARLSSRAREVGARPYPPSLRGGAFVSVIARPRSGRSNPGGGAARDGRAAYIVAARLLDCFALASLALAMTVNRFPRHCEAAKRPKQSRRKVQHVTGGRRTVWCGCILDCFARAPRGLAMTEGRPALESRARGGGTAVRTKGTGGLGPAADRGRRIRRASRESAQRRRRRRGRPAARALLAARTGRRGAGRACRGRRRRHASRGRRAGAPPRPPAAPGRSSQAIERKRESMPLWAGRAAGVLPRAALRGCGAPCVFFAQHLPEKRHKPRGKGRFFIASQVASANLPLRRRGAPPVAPSGCSACRPGGGEQGEVPSALLHVWCCRTADRTLSRNNCLGGSR